MTLIIFAAFSLLPCAQGEGQECPGRHQWLCLLWTQQSPRFHVEWKGAADCISSH